MSKITANSTAAYFTYTGGWSSVTSDPGSRTWQKGDEMKLRIQGSALYLYGKLLPSDPGTSTGNISSQCNVKINTQSSNSTYTGNTTAGDERDFLICTIPSLDANKPNNITLSLDFLGEGFSGFNLDRVEWTDPNLSNQPKKPINGNSAFINSTNWTPNGDGSSCTISNNATMQFKFEGTSVVVKGMATSQNLNATYSVSVDNSSTVTPGDSDRWEAYAFQDQIIDLYRNDSLANGNHTILFSDIQPGGQLCVLRADVSGPVPSTTVVPSSTSVPSPSGMSPSSLPSGPLSRGRTAGIVVGVLLAVGIIVGGALFVYRRRMGYGGIALDAKKMRYCSKCGTAITNRYRMECVQAESCVQDVDLHVKCQDWNIPTNHSHPIHKTVNK
ncbi:unnamed protein product [Rhizoctonia solani]|uniref:Transmembrane protein n=1 Tax=Rhizoctonia solani TaxID=456999 RepID=A0A8H3GIS8_9AGAM|nr:unnamed protein product [Rhizoctonia solani]CAE6483878.1 unnamed protein product [Rhizoctonia solani]